MDELMKLVAVDDGFERVVDGERKLRDGGVGEVYKTWADALLMASKSTLITAGAVVQTALSLLGQARWPQSFVLDF